MKYETPELTALSTAIDAIQVTAGIKASNKTHFDGTGNLNDSLGAYEDWE